jgi:hypothetical protein
MLSYTLEDASGESSGYSYLTIDDIKTYLGVDGSSHDSLLTDMYYAIASYLEITTKQSLKDRDVVIKFDRDERFYDLLFRPVTSITSVTSYTANDTSGALTELTDYKAYGLNTTRTRGVNLKLSSRHDELEVAYNSNGSTVPYEFKLATLAWLKILYDDNRQFEPGAFGNKVIPPKETLQLIQPYISIVI